MKICIVCGKTFEGKGNAKYCSEECRNAKVITNDHVGEIHYQLEIKSAYRQNSQLYVNCECSCGKKCTIRYDRLLSGNTTSCGCIGKKNLLKPIDLTGKVNSYGVRALYQIGKGDKSYIWHCVCSCGKEFDIAAQEFKKIKSCGCAQDKARRKQANTILSELREAARQDGTYIFSIKNKKMLKNNKSGIRGVCWNNSRNKWVAQITFKGKNYYLGRYDKIEEAAKIRKIAEEKIFGDFLKWFAEEFPERWEKINKKGK